MLLEIDQIAVHRQRSHIADRVLDTKMELTN